MNSPKMLQKILNIFLIFIGSVTLGIGVVLMTGGSLQPLAQGIGGEDSAGNQAALPTPAATAETVANTATSTPAPPTNTVAAIASPTIEPITDTPIPTNTPIPTDTPGPTDTPTPLDTATPTTAPVVTPDTASPSPELASNAFIQDSFDTPASGWPVRSAETWSAAYVDGRYQLTLDGRQTAGVSIPVQPDNYRMGVDVILGEQGDAGLIVLFGEPSTFYQIALRPDGSYAIQRLEQSTITDVVEWTVNPALQPGAGVTNRLRIERQGSTISFYANDQLLTDFTVPDESLSNRFGFTLRSSTGQGEASFDNLEGQPLPDA